MQKKNGLPINHRGRQINRTDFREFDYIIAMDDQNLRSINNLKVRYNYDEKQIFLMRNFVSQSEGLSVPDPYYGDEQGFEEVFNILNEAIEGFLEKIKVAHQLYA